ncbi:ATP phosphoribosyltransferase [Propionicicella superfundia]|uniref:ATP phosphoribosyltransferase n=1 Tax=Propionicicella superfundia TaxID=348582 RepID=UPI0004217803|nr:ATP phosphoribosyltransferase [Propionicicella superfundia]
MTNQLEPLKIAVPNKGSLSEAATQMLRDAGYRQRHDNKELVLVDEEHSVEFYYLRPRDIALYVGEGTLDLGITGRDMLLDSGANAEEIMALGFGGTRFRFAGPSGREYETADLEGHRIATSYPGLVEQYLATRGISARLIRLDGAVESSIRLGVADFIADVVETGTTLRAAGLTVFGEPLLQSEAILIRRAGTPETPALGQLSRRLSGVLVARDYLMIDYVVPKVRLAEASRITPGLASPTVSPVENETEVAVRAMVPAKKIHAVMDELLTVDAEAIVVTRLASCRL